MPGLAPGIHAFSVAQEQDADCRDKPGNDG